jgi:hypothetical protein
MSSATPPQADHERLGHPLAQRLWAQLRDRSEVDRRYVFDLLQARLGVADLGGKQEVAAEALRQFIAARTEQTKRIGDGDSADLPSWAGDTPSRKNYDNFRANQPSAREWPSSTYIRNAFDNDWQAGLAAVGNEPGPDITARRLIVSTNPYTPEEILAAVRLWVAEVDEEQGPESPLLQTRYEKWARTRRSVDDPSIKRLPRRTTLNRFFGDWQHVLVALGCPHRHRFAQAPPTSATGCRPDGAEEPAATLDLDDPPPESPRTQVTHSPETARTRARVAIAWLRWLVDQLPEEERTRLRMEDFERYMSSIRRLTLARGKPLHPPSHAAFERSSEIDGWLDAKRQAGILHDRAPAKRSTKAYSESDLIVAVLAVLSAMGRDVNRSGYMRWRKMQRRRLPSESKIRHHFSDTGSWAVAVENCLHRADELGIKSVGQGPTMVDLDRAAAYRWPAHRMAYRRTGSSPET